MNHGETMKIADIKSIDDIIKYEENSNLKQDICKLIHPLTFESNTNEQLLEIIKTLQLKWVDLLQGPFISKQQEIIFYLTKLEGQQRNRALGITEEHYVNEELAKKWYKKLRNRVHPDKGGSKEAFRILTDIYNILVSQE